MALLWLITLLWAFSFSLIGVYLAGQVDAYIAVASRTFLALLIFLPFLRKVHWKQALTLMAIGAIQIGIMYLFLYKAYRYLSVPELLLFTIFTPLYVSLFADLFAKRLPRNFWAPALLAIAGAAVIRWTELQGDYWRGFLLIQAANACFAFGQVWYRHNSAHSTRTNHTHSSHKTRFAWFFLGAVIVNAIAMINWADWSKLPTTNIQYGVLLWLGVMASGFGYLGWNIGSTRVTAQQLAVMNNMLIPAGILVNVFIWNGHAEWLRLSIGGAFMIAALYVSSRKPSG